MRLVKMEEIQKKWENPMRKPYLSKVTVNIGVGESGEKLEKARALLEFLTGQAPIKNNARQTNKDFAIRKSEPIAVSVTLRREKAIKFLMRTLEAVEFNIKERSFDTQGNFSFGIKEHIDLPDVQYDPDVGIFGMDVCVNLQKRGYRVKERRIKKSHIPRRHQLTKEEGIIFAKQEFGVNII
ncbi:MAG: 50S ribosomal protein L5 [Candidatus Methanofastidiosum sp.]|jgi:large subunit ribosomal protein L5|nr:50S ribosomal protein L5 [Methanofastidiosum sp.]